MKAPTGFILQTIVASLIFGLTSMIIAMAAAAANVTSPMQVFALAVLVGSASVVYVLNLAHSQKSATRPPAQQTSNPPAG